MPLFADDRPRGHHYLFAHRVLPSDVPALVQHARALVANGHIDDALRDRWNGLVPHLGGDTPVAPDGLHATLERAGDADVLLVTFPRPEHAPEAYFAAVVLTEPPRYFVLEHAWDTEDRPYTVLGSWAGDRHLNYGPGPEPDPAAFLAAVAERLTP